LVTELNNGKYKIEKIKWKTNFPFFQAWLLCKIKFVIPLVSLPPSAPPPHPMLLAKLRLCHVLTPHVVTRKHHATSMTNFKSSSADVGFCEVPAHSTKAHGTAQV
jgi:hypothetical protein